VAEGFRIRRKGYNIAKAALRPIADSIIVCVAEDLIVLGGLRPSIVAGGGTPRSSR